MVRLDNPTGRRYGSRNTVTVASSNLLEGEGEALIRKLIELALDGNVSCLRHAIDCLHPVNNEIKSLIYMRLKNIL